MLINFINIVLNKEKNLRNQQSKKHSKNQMKKKSVPLNLNQIRNLKRLWVIKISKI